MNKSSYQICLARSRQGSIRHSSLDSKILILKELRLIIALMLFLLITYAVKPCWAAENQIGKEPPQVLRATLDNGLRVVVVRNSLAPVVTTVVNYLVGSDEAPQGFPGMAHAQEHMMFRGSPDLSAAQLANITAAMGGMFDADTQQSVTQYFFTVPKEDLDVALRIEAIRMRGVLNTEALWEPERGAIEQEVAQDLSSPEYVFYTQLLAAMFKGTAYEHDALGTRQSFDQTTGAMLKEFYDTWYTPNNAILVIVGDVQLQATLDEVKKLFSDIPSKNLPEKPAINLEPVKPETLRLKTDQPFGLAIVAFRMPGYDSPDYAASEVLSDVLSSRLGDLYNLVVEGKAIQTTFELNTLPKSGVGYAAAAFPKGADGDTLLEQMRTLLIKSIQSGFPSDLVNAAKRREIADAEFEKNSIEGLAMTWSQALAVEGRESPEEDVTAIRKVTVEDVNRIARQYIDMSQAISAVLTPEPSGKPTASKGFGGRESFTPPKTERVQLPDWAENALKRLNIPTSTLNPTVYTLPNGLKLIVQPETISDTVGVYGHVRNNPDLEAPKGQEGVDKVLEQLLSFGTKSLDRVAFQKALDEIGATESPGTDFSLRVLIDQFDRGVELLADNILHPALPENAFKVLQPQIAATVAGELLSPDFLAGQALRRGIYPKGDPTLRHATPESVSALTLQKVGDYYKKVFRPDLTTIVVIGKVTPERAKQVVGRFFGGWTAKGPKPQTVLPPVPLNNASAMDVPDTSRVQDKVTLTETLGLNRYNPDYYALQLGNRVLGGAFYATRLYRDLRLSTGLVYYVSSSFDMGRSRGRYEAKFASDPSNVGKARAIIVENLKAMRNTPVPPDELQQARAILLREIPLSESSVHAIAIEFLARSALDLPLDEPIRAAHKYVNLSADQVQAAFARWVRPDSLVQVTQGPVPQ